VGCSPNYGYAVINRSNICFTFKNKVTVLSKTIKGGLAPPAAASSFSGNNNNGGKGRKQEETQNTAMV